MYIGMLPLLGNVYPHQAVIPLRTSCPCKPLLVSVSNILTVNFVVGWCLYLRAQ